MDERDKTKDAYDLYFCLHHYEGGPAALAEAMQPLVGEDAADRAFKVLRGKFRSLDSKGPVDAASVEVENGGDYDFTRRDAFERMNRLLDLLDTPA